MIIFKLKNKIFNDLSYEEVDGYFWTSINKSWTLLFKKLQEVEGHEKFEKFEFLPENFMYFQKPNPSDLAKPKQVGEYIKLLDGHEWKVKTIAHIKRRYIHAGFDETGKVKIEVEQNDPLFDYLSENIKRLKSEIDIDFLLDIIIACLKENYYITKEIALALKLFDDDTIQKTIFTIYQYDTLRRVSNDFFRTSTNEFSTGESDPAGVSNSL